MGIAVRKYGSFESGLWNLRSGFLEKTACGQRRKYNPHH